jgi:hypothetical protein
MYTRLFRSPSPRVAGRFVAPRGRHAAARTAATRTAAVACAVLAGCRGSRPAAADVGPPRAAVRLAPQQWRAIPCATCPGARITVETRYSVTASGRAGSHTFARVRNANPHAVALVVAFVPDHTAHGDGYVPSEQWPLRLGASGSPGADTVVHLHLPAVVRATVHDVERY